MSSSLPRGAPVPTKIASKPSAEQRLHAGDVGVVANLDAHVENLVDLVHENGFRQAKGRDVGAHQAARPVVLFEHDDFVAQGHQVVRDRERGRPRADTGDALSVFLAGDLGKAIRDVVAQVGRDAFEAADGDRFAIHSATAAGRFAGPIARAAENGGEHIRLPVEHVGVGIAALRDQADVFRNIGVSRTGPLTVHHFVKVVRVADVRGVQTWNPFDQQESIDELVGAKRISMLPLYIWSTEGGAWPLGATTPDWVPREESRSQKSESTDGRFGAIQSGR